MTVRYTTSLDRIRPDHLAGFFDGWPEPPSPDAHLRILQHSHRAVLATTTHDDELHVLGFATAVSDGVLAAYIPLLEVRPAHRRRGIGTRLIHHLLAALDDLYMVDLVCDPDLAPFYERLGFTRLSGMARRNPAPLRALSDARSSNPDDPST